MEAQEALAGAREVFGTESGRGTVGACNLPAREAIFLLLRICPTFPAKRTGKSGKFVEGGRINGENMG